mgnify:FL=1
MPTERLLGDPVAADVRDDVASRVRDLRDRGTVPTLGTVLMSDDAGDARFMDLKHDACEDVGIETRDERLAPDDPAADLYRTVEDLADDDAVDALFVQAPLPEHVETNAVRRRVDPLKDVDCFHPENLGRLVGGDPRFVPATPAAVRRLLAAHDVELDGEHVVVVGRSDVIGKPLANLLLQDEPGGNATVTVCHSHTSDLASVTRRGDVVVTACGVPELVDGSMLSSGVVVVDVSANRRQTGDGDVEVVGDVDFESARSVAAAVTPVPGGVGPMTRAALLGNVALAAERRTDRQ